LFGDIYYARLFPDVAGKLAEESDRYPQALLYQQRARACFRDAELRFERLHPR
jgi:hypothetical protein